MSQHNTFRKVIAAAAISTAIGLTSLAGGAASADGPKAGSEVLVYTITLTNATVVGTPASVAPIHRTTDVTLKRGIVGGFKAMTGTDQADSVPAQPCSPLICGSNSPISSTPFFN